MPVGCSRKPRAVFTTANTRTTICLPTAPNLSLLLLVWIRGYANFTHRPQLRVHVDGCPVTHQTVHADGYAGLLTDETRSIRDSVRLEIDLGQTPPPGAPGTQAHDNRARCICFDSYGWRPVP
jgi:hypothetical protein